MFRPICEVHTFGLIDYQEVWDLQDQFAAAIAAGERPPTLLLNCKNEYSQKGATHLPVVYLCCARRKSALHLHKSNFVTDA